MRRGNSGLKFIFHIKDNKGCIFNTYLTPLDLNTEIFYADGYVTPFITLSLSKDQNPPEQSIPIYNAWLTVTVLLV